jgi:hypothetical protein
MEMLGTSAKADIGSRHIDVVLLGHGMDNGDSVVVVKKECAKHSISGMVLLNPAQSVVSMKHEICLSLCGMQGPAGSLTLGRKPKGCGAQAVVTLVKIPSEIELQGQILAILVMPTCLPCRIH